MMQNCTIHAYTFEKKDERKNLFDILNTWEKDGKLQYHALKNAKRVDEFMRIMFCQDTMQTVVDHWDKSKAEDFRNDKEFKHEKNEPCRSYKKVETKNVQSSRTTKVTPPKGGRSSSSGDNALDNALLIKFGCFFALITIVKMFLRKCRKKPRWGIFGR